MIEKLPPRPPSVTAFCVLLALVSSFNLFHGMFLMNSVFYESKGQDLLLTVFTGPAIALTCALFMYRGRNWARLVFWGGYTPFGIWLLTAYPVDARAILRVVVCGLGFIITLRPNAHWFFTGRDYLRRLQGKRSRRSRQPAPSSDPARRSPEYRY